MGQKDSQEVEIDLREILIVILDRLWIIIAIGIAVAALAGVFTKVFVTPMYTSTTKLYVLNKQNESSAVTYADLQTGASLTQDYLILVTGNKVLDRVIEDLNLDTTAGALASRITVSNPTNTRFIVISVEDADPVVAKEIAERVARVSSEVVVEVMDIDKVNVAEDASLPTGPSSPDLKKNVLIGGVAGVLLTIIVIVIIYLLNDSIRTAEDVEKYLGLNTLGSIPMLNSGESKANKRKRAKREKRKRIDELEDIEGGADSE